MHDKVLGFIRETLLHENIVDRLSVDLSLGEVRLNLLQPNPDYYPDPELLLTFGGVREFLVRDVGSGDRYGDELLGIDCAAEQDVYCAVITVGNAGSASWWIHLVFADLRYKRTRSSD